VCFDLLELRHRVTVEGLLHLLGEEPLAFLVQAPPRGRVEEPVSLVREEDFEGVGVCGRAEAQELRDVEDDAFGFDVEGSRGSGVAVNAW
jgi:hypothetical protein